MAMAGEGRPRQEAPPPPPRCCQGHCCVDNQTGPSCIHSLTPNVLQPNTQGHLLRAPHRPPTGREHTHNLWYMQHTYTAIPTCTYTCMGLLHTSTHRYMHHTPTHIYNSLPVHTAHTYNTYLHTHIYIINTHATLRVHVYVLSHFSHV